jgi:hypothetical protein
MFYIISIADGVDHEIKSILRGSFFEIFFSSYEKYVSKMNFKNILKLRSFLLIRKYNSEA